MNRNDYTSISIIKDKIKVKSNSHFETIKTSKSFCEEIKKKSDEEIISSIIDYFLEYNRITGLDDDFIVNGKRYIAVFSNDKILKISSDTIIGKDNLTKIINKYLSDRVFYFNNILVNKYIIGRASYKKTSYFVHDDTLVFNLLCSGYNDNLLIKDFEKEFIEYFINTLFEDKIINFKKQGNHNTINYLVCEDNEISVCIPSSFYGFISKCVYYHNEKVKEKGKNLQLKMEGF